VAALFSLIGKKSPAALFPVGGFVAGGKNVVFAACSDE
jgi:hypothetical protein